MKFFQAESNNKTANVIFYTFQCVALVYFFVMFVLAIVFAAQTSSFMAFVETFLQGVFNSLVLYGLGRIIDFISIKKDNE